MTEEITKTGKEYLVLTMSVMRERRKFIRYLNKKPSMKDILRKLAETGKVIGESLSLAWSPPVERSEGEQEEERKKVAA